MKKIVWEVQCLVEPPILRYCRKCKEKKEFLCSGQFRINAQRKSLDIWLIYKCKFCGTTWNAEVYSHISPQAIKPELLEAFYGNDEALARQISVDPDFLRRNKVETGLPVYHVIGDTFSPDEEVMLEIKSKHSINIRVASIIRKKLHLSQKDYLKLIDDGKVRSIPETDLRKCRLRKGIVLIFSGSNS